MSRHLYLPLGILLVSLTGLGAQNFPPTIQQLEASHLLLTGKQSSVALYDEAQVKTFKLWFSQADYWNKLTANYATHTDLPATLVVENDTFFDVGVRFKGQTSYNMTQGKQKKSFNLTLDYLHPDQQIDGYNTLNLNNAFEDASFMREVVYLHQIRKHVPAAKAAYVHLYINDQDWGLYPNVQQLDGNYINEWFWNNDGTRWRADRPDGQVGGGGPGGGPGWGDGTAALNDLGADSTEYKKYYTLKSTGKSNPWDDLIRVCDVLNNTLPDSLESKISALMDLDRTLWFLASEIAFSDDDSYVYKGKMDYYLYWDTETERMTPLEFDGNSAFKTSAANWGVFYNANKVNYPLLNRLLAVPAIRQRYLAHFRTLVADEMNQTEFDALIAQFDALIKPLVQSDPKKLYTLAEYETQKNALKTFVQNHRNTLSADLEFAQQGPVIASALMHTEAGDWINPAAGVPAHVQATVTHANGISSVNLYYSPKAYGRFARLSMFDDGQHNDGASGDGVYGAEIPGQENGALVRFYVEAIANNTAKSRAYLPQGAEHDVYYYRVGAIWADERLVAINEVMSSNATTQADEAGEFDDWVELYNLSDQPVFLEGYALSDNAANPQKWTFPAGVVIPAQGYLVVWADEDQGQGNLHSNFKLSAGGEALMLFNADKRLVDTVNVPSLNTDVAYARLPNGTGPFVKKTATFGANNGTVGVKDIAAPAFEVFPNPVQETLHIVGPALTDAGLPLQVYDAQGRLVWEEKAASAYDLEVKNWDPGRYSIRIGAVERVFVKL